MNRIACYFRELIRTAARDWNRFWFTPTDSATLCLVRIFAGAMLFYTYAVWSLDLTTFFGPHGWINSSAMSASFGNRPVWSHAWWCESPAVLWMVHAGALTVFALFTLGLWTRMTSVLAFLLTVSYANRAQLALFGLDQINALLAMYLMLGPCGSAYSLDAWFAYRRDRRARGFDTENLTSSRRLGRIPLRHNCQPDCSVSANIAIRLIQCHLCVIYLFAGLSKLQGPAWWNGTALWNAVANLEYQSIDMTWLARYPLVINLLTHVTIAWEISYVALIWPRLTRPLVLLLAIPLHLGIAVCLGMTTFGLVMLIANVAFVSPALIREVVETSMTAARKLLVTRPGGRQQESPLEKEPFSAVR